MARMAAYVSTGTAYSQTATPNRIEYPDSTINAARGSWQLHRQAATASGTPM